MWRSKKKLRIEVNPNHEPSGSSSGGQFTSGGGGSAEPVEPKKGVTRRSDPRIGGTVQPKKHKNADKVVSTLKLETDKDIRKDVFAVFDPNPKVSFMKNRNGHYFMAEDGEFIKGGQDTHGEVGARFAKDLDLKDRGQASDWDNSRDIMARTNMIRITIPFGDDGLDVKRQSLGIDIAGEKITPAQLRRIRQYEKEGIEIAWDVTDSSGNTAGFGSDFKGMAKALRDVEMMTEAKDKKLPVFHIKLRKKAKEDVIMTGPHGRPAFKKKKKQRFEFIANVADFYSLEEAKILHFDHGSSFVASVTYEKETKEMLGVLGEKLYQWCQVPREIYDGWRTASSKGRFFNENIRGLWDC